MSHTCRLPVGEGHVAAVDDDGAQSPGPGLLPAPGRCDVVNVGHPEGGGGVHVAPRELLRP